ncbi:MAG: ion transporter [Ardenticatenaceae bacterium]
MINQPPFIAEKNFKHHPFFRSLINENLVLMIIVINTIVLILHAFPEIEKTPFGEALHWIDYACMIYFVIEAVLKIWILSFRGYWQSGWNKLDFVIVVSGLPLLLSPFFPIINSKKASIGTLLRLGRFLRFWRMMRFVPNAAHIWKGVIRALKASVGVFLVLLGLNFILAMGANMLFGEIAPEHFGNPLLSIYSMFKVFTVEGWYEIPDQLAERGILDYELVLLRCYFSVAVLVGGVLGLSLANAVFVDEMTTDNNEHVEEMIAELRLELQDARSEAEEAQGEQWVTLQATLKEMQQEMARLKR